MYIFEDSLTTVREGDGTVFKGLGIRHNAPVSMYCDKDSGAVITQFVAEAALLLRDIILDDSAEDRMFWERDGSFICFDFLSPREWRFANLAPMRCYGVLDGERLLVGGASYGGNIKAESMNAPEYNFDVVYMLLAELREIIADRQCRAAFSRLMHSLTKQNIAEFCACILTEEKMYTNYLKGFLPDAEINTAALSFGDFKAEVTSSPLSENFSGEEAGGEAGDDPDEVIDFWGDSDSDLTDLLSEEDNSSNVTRSDILRFNKDDFSDDDRELIPDLPPEIVIPDEMLSFCSAVTAGDITSMLIHGPAGTGKTMSCKLICQEIGLPLMATINCTENLDEFVLGKFLPENDRIVFRESYVTKAIRDGGAVVFEEINFAKPQYLAFLNSLLDDNGFVRLDNGVTVKRHRNFRFFATMNRGYFGTKELNQALYNRFGVIVELDELSDEAVAKMLSARVPECEPYIEKILHVYHLIKHNFEAEESDCIISPRNLEVWARMAKYMGFVIAAEYTLVSTAKSDRDMEEKIRSIVAKIEW